MGAEPQPFTQSNTEPNSPTGPRTKLCLLLQLPLWISPENLLWILSSTPNNELCLSGISPQSMASTVTHKSPSSGQTLPQNSRLHTRLSKSGRGWPPPTSVGRFIPFPYWGSPTISAETLGSRHSLLLFFSRNVHISGLPNPTDTPPRMYSVFQSPGP